MRSTTLRNTYCAAALLMAIAAPAFAQSATTTSPAATTPSGAPHEGIKVHGDWTLTVRNPDGTVAAVHEFKNALSVNLGADAFLARLLGGQAVASHWIVFLNTTVAASCSPNAAFLCSIIEGGSLSGADSRDLTRTVPTTGPDAGKLVLRGSVRVPVNLSIAEVGTQVTTCAATVSPAACLSAPGTPVTRKMLAPSVPVVADQLVEVKVVISFS